MSTKLPEKNEPEILPPVTPSNAAKARGVMYSGPLPPPSMLRGYDEIVPGAAKRIIRMAERSQRSMNKTREDHIQYMKLGQLFGFAISMVALIAAFILALVGKEATASIIGGTTVVGLATAFIVGALRK